MMALSPEGMSFEGTDCRDMDGVAEHTLGHGGDG